MSNIHILTGPVYKDKKSPANANWNARQRCMC